MKVRTIMAELVILLICGTSTAQSTTTSLPTFKQDNIFTVGKLANGINYYFASNPTQKGLMDISLIQKVDSQKGETELEEIASSNFFKTKSLTSSFRDFLTRNGIGPTEEGYFNVAKGSICYDFTSLSSAMPEIVMDSTLLAIFELAKLHAQMDEPTDAQAIIIVGDFDQKVILSKLKLLSMITPRAEGALPPFEYSYKNEGERKGIKITRDGALAKLELEWTEARTPQEYMKTVLPVISDKLAGELGWVLRRRLESVFNLNKVHCWMDFSYRNSSMSPYDEKILFCVNCMSSDVPLVEDIMQRELSRLYTWGVDPVEYNYAHDIHRYRWVKSAKAQIKDNSIFRDMCTAAFLYDAPLAKEEDKINFAYREMPLEKQTELFNSYMKKLLGQSMEENRSLSQLPYLKSRMEIDGVMAGFKPATTVKLSKENLEPITGGLMRTCANGVNLIHKQMNTNGITYFCLASKGGRASLDEKAFLNVEGLEDEAVSTYLAASGIDIRPVFTPYDVRIVGSVVNENIPVLLQYLCGICGNPANAGVFGEKCFKLLTFVSDLEPHSVTAIAAKYCAGLGQGGNWLPGKPVDEGIEDATDMKDFTLYESVFTLDNSGRNMATSQVAAYALNDALLKEFKDVPVYMRNWSSYPGYPIGSYRLLFGVSFFNSHDFSPLKKTGESELREGLHNVVASLAGTPVPQDRLKTFKILAKNAFKTWEQSAMFYITAANDRYLDNRNFWTRYPQLIDSVTEHYITDFYDSANSSNR